MDTRRRCASALAAAIAVLSGGAAPEPARVAHAQAADPTWSALLPQSGNAADEQASEADGELRRVLENLRRDVRALGRAIIDADRESAEEELEEAEAERREAAREREAAERDARAARAAREAAQGATASARARADAARAQVDASGRRVLDMEMGRLRGGTGGAGFGGTGVGTAAGTPDGPIRSVDDYFSALENMVAVMESTPCETMDEALLARYNRATARLDRANRWGMEAARSDPTLEQRIASDPRNARLTARAQRARARC